MSFGIFFFVSLIVLGAINISTPKIGNDLLKGSMGENIGMAIGVLFFGYSIFHDAFGYPMLLWKIPAAQYFFCFFMAMFFSFGFSFVRAGVPCWNKKVGR